MPEIESDEEYRYLASRGAGNREVGRALLRYASLNPHVKNQATGMQALEQSEPFQSQAREIAADEASAAEVQRQADRRKLLGPEIAAAEDELEAAEGPEKIRRMFPEENLPIGEDEALNVVNATGKLRSAFSHLASASKDPSLYAPPEFMPDGATSSTKILAAERYFEPTVDEFRREKGAELAQKGIDPNTLDEDSDEYKRFADERWQRVHTTAAWFNRPIVRDAFKKNEGWGEQVASAAARGTDKLRALGLGFVGGYLPGADDLFFGKQPWSHTGRVELVDPDPFLALERHPGLNIGGTILGAITPTSLAARVAGGAYKAVVPAGAALGRKVLGGAIAGGTAGAAEGITELAGQAMSDRQEDPEAVAKTGLLMPLVGLAGGAAGELIGAGAGALRQKFRQGPVGEKIKLAEEAGYETSVLQGMKPGPEIKAQIDEARSRGVKHPYVEMAEDVADKGAQVIADEQERIARDITTNVDGYYAATDNAPEAHRAATNTIQRLMDSIKAMRSESGDVASVARPLRERLERLVRVRTVSADEASDLMEAGGDAMILGEKELADLGYTPADVARMSPSASPRSRGWNQRSLVGGSWGRGDKERKWFAVEPVKMSPRTFDELVRDIDSLAGEIQNRTSHAHPAFKELAEGIHRDREAFPAHPLFAPEERVYEVPVGALGERRNVSGWAALKAQSDERLRGLENLSEGAGFPKKMPPRAAEQLTGPEGEVIHTPKKVGGKTLPKLSPAERERATKTVANLHGPGREQEALAQGSWDDLAKRGGFEEDLSRVAGVRYGEELRTGGAGRLRGVVGPPFEPSVYVSLGQEAKLRADPPLRALSANPYGDVAPPAKKTSAPKAQGAEPLDDVPKILPKPSDQVETPKVAPETARAVEMFSRGYDSTIRAVERGEAPEKILEHLRTQKRMRESPEEHLEAAQQAAEELQRFFKSVPPSKVRTVYRGIVVSPEDYRKLFSGDTIDMGGMTSSASADPVVARSFVARERDAGAETYGVVLKLHQKSARPMGALSSKKNLGAEKELLIPGSARFRVKRRYRDPSDSRYVVIEAEEVGKSGKRLGEALFGLRGGAPGARAAAAVESENQ